MHVSSKRFTEEGMSEMIRISLSHTWGEAVSETRVLTSNFRGAKHERMDWCKERGVFTREAILFTNDGTSEVRWGFGKGIGFRVRMDHWDTESDFIRQYLWDSVFSTLNIHENSSSGWFASRTYLLNSRADDLMEEVQSYSHGTEHSRASGVCRSHVPRQWKIRNMELQLPDVFLVGRCPYQECPILLENSTCSVCWDFSFRDL